MLNENGLPIKRDPGLVVLAVVLWMLTSVVSFLEILTVRAIVLRIYGRFAITYGFYSRGLRPAQGLGAATVFVMAIACMGVAIGCGEYHLNNFGQPQSWKLFTWTIAAEVAILVLALFV